MKPCFLGRSALLAFLLLSFAVPVRAHVAADEMSAAAEKFLSSLDVKQKGQALFGFKEEERSNWHFVPRVRNGLPIGQMKAEQRQLALGLLRSGMSESGYEKSTNIMSLELILRDMEKANPRMVRDPELYYFSIFGKPGAHETWGWRVEGHHLSANFTIVKGEIFANTPSFFGTNPAMVKEGSRKGLRVLAEEEDLGRQLIQSLTDDQRKEAIFSSTAPSEIITSNNRKVKPLEQAGIAGAKLNEKQSAQLAKVIQSYLNRVRPELAKLDWEKIEKAGLDKVHFAWAGSVEKEKPPYYRVQGPTFLLEYDNTQNNANHIHAVWRDFENDFGDDLLRRHYKEVAH